MHVHLRYHNCSLCIMRFISCESYCSKLTTCKEECSIVGLQAVAGVGIENVIKLIGCDVEGLAFAGHGDLCKVIAQADGREHLAGLVFEFGQTVGEHGQGLPAREDVIREFVFDIT